MKLLITAGPTREYIDSVRFLSNASTGQMGIYLAQKALEKKWEVSLVLGPTHLQPPRKAFTLRVVSTQEMYNAVWELMKLRKPEGCVMTAAPCDFQPEKRVQGKIKKGTQKELDLKLVATPDILRSVGQMENPPILCGFALESENILEYARKKLQEKNLDLIVANNPQSFAGSSLEGATILFRDGREEALGSIEKEEMAERILKEMEELYEKK